MTIQIKTEESVIRLKSILLSFATILDKLLAISVNKQQAILEQNWNEVFLLTNEQQDVAKFINEKDAELVTVMNMAGTQHDDKLDELKSRIRELIGCYRETESLNAQMMDDNMFIVRQKFEQMYNVREDSVYTKDMKKQKNDFGKQAMLINNLA
ncbi:MAG: hypothetical protein IKQ61_07340 [Spirochaetales bacterium]|nr:hypothetical protein [Spirochaetales bacterium]MBR6061800.1 hypothetical protein [Spirochaetales bacterium]MBR6200056.1 hypothetical protein [Spirochaetales bacterium]